MRKLIFLALCLCSSFLYSQETVTLYITDGNDDAYSNSVEYEEIMFVDTDSLAMARLGSPNRIFNIGLRYQSVPIPPGSIIDSAFIQFTPFKADDENHVFNITCEKNVNPEAFTNEVDNIKDRSRKYQDTDWWVAEWGWEADHRSRTHDVKDLIQYVIDMEGWETNNPMVFIFEGLGGLGNQVPKLACSFEYGAEWYAPSLTVTFTAPASVSELSFAKQVNVFPNPVSDKFTLSFKELKKGEYSISLLDLQGRKVHEVYSGQLANGDHQFNVSADELKLEQGIYLLSIQNTMSNVTQKIVIN